MILQVEFNVAFAFENLEDLARRIRLEGESDPLAGSSHLDSFLHNLVESKYPSEVKRDLRAYFGTAVVA